jgi:hypothetical protein
MVIAPLPAITIDAPVPAIGITIGAPVPAVIDMGPGITWVGVVGGAAEPAVMTGWVIVGGGTVGVPLRT